MWYGDYLPTVIPQTVGTQCVQDVDPADRGPIGLTVEKWDNADILTMNLGFPLHNQRIPFAQDSLLNLKK